MNRLLLAALFALVPLAARADSFIMQLVITGGPTYTFTQVIPGPTGASGNAALLFQPWALANYPNTCTPIAPATTCTPATTTAATAWQLFGAAMYHGIVANVNDYLKSNARTTAEAAVVPMQ